MAKRKIRKQGAATGSAKRPTPRPVKSAAKSRRSARATPAAAASAPSKARSRAAGGAAPSARRASPAPSSAGVRLPRDPKGRRAQFYADPAIDQLWAVVAALTGEVSVAFDRLDTVERVLDRHGHVTREAIEAYRPDEAASAERAKKREELIARVFQVLSQYAG